jgi:hypothetical protein
MGNWWNDGTMKKDLFGCTESIQLDLKMSLSSVLCISLMIVRLHQAQIRLEQFGWHELFSWSSTNRCWAYLVLFPLSLFVMWFPRTWVDWKYNAWLSDPRDVRVGSNSNGIVTDIDILGIGHVPAEEWGPIWYVNETNVHRWEFRSGLSSISCRQHNIAIPISFRNLKMCTVRVWRPWEQCKDGQWHSLKSALHWIRRDLDDYLDTMWNKSLMTFETFGPLCMW